MNRWKMSIGSDARVAVVVLAITLVLLHLTWYTVEEGVGRTLKLELSFPRKGREQDQSENLQDFARLKDVPQRKGKKAQVKLVYLHIHKGGGTTMCELAHRNGEKVAHGGNCNLPTSQRLALAQGTIFQQRRLLEKMDTSTFVGNEWGLPEKIYHSENLMYITVLRNPIARTESHFAMAISQIKHAVSIYQAKCRFPSWVAHVTNAKPPVSRVLQRIWWVKHVPDNWQVRAICGAICSRVPFGKLARSHLELAKRRLVSEFALFGILEHFELSMEVFASTIGWKAPKNNVHGGTSHDSLTKVNHHAHANDTLNEEMMRWFKAVNLFDLELYAFAVDAFRARLSAQGLDSSGVEPVALPNGDEKSMLESMVNVYTEQANCSATCCTKECAPIGYFWESTAISLHYIANNCKCYGEIQPYI